MSKTDDRPTAMAVNRNLYPPSPCVSVCTLDDDTGYCMGCGRTVEQSAGWTRMSKAEQWAVIDELAARDRRA